MKANPLIFFLVLAMGLTARGQVYTLTTPISGSMTMSAGDQNGPAGSSGSFTLQFNTLTETIYIDPIAETIRQVGVISYTASATNISFQETQQIQGVFPNPPTNVIGSVTVTLATSGNGLSFDTGNQPATWNPSIGGYTFNSGVSSFLNMNGSYALISGGQTNAGVFNYDLNYYFFSGSGPNTFNKVSTYGYPQTLTFSGLGYYNGPWGDIFTPTPDIVADVATTNGFHMQLRAGVLNVYGCGGTGEIFQWSSPDNITATNIPGSVVLITNQPQSAVVYANTTASFSVGVTGDFPINYQWQLNGTNIAGATFSTLNISSVKQSDLGIYSVIVSNALGSVTSSNAILSMYPLITTPFTGAVTTWGKSASFGIQAWGTGPLNYQWFKDGVAIAGATNASVNFASIQFTNSGMYSVVVSSPLGSVTNAAAQVIVNPAGVALGFCPALTISGVAGYSYTIQSSPNLMDTNAWVTLTNLTLSQPVQIWVDTTVDASSPFNSKYFYRILPGQ
jgi:Immunoglobulin I-set domain